MAEITIQRTGEFLRKLVEILMAHPEGIRAQDVLNTLQQSVQLTEYEKGQSNRGAACDLKKLCALRQ